MFPAGDELPAPRLPVRGDGILEAPGPVAGAHAEGFELLRSPPEPHAEHEPAVRDQVDDRRVLGDAERLSGASNSPVPMRTFLVRTAIAADSGSTDGR